MQIPIINGIYTDASSDLRGVFPRNLMVVAPMQTGISDAYLRPASGIVSFGTGTGVDRGGINWRGLYYRVMGNQLLRINQDGSSDVLGTIPGTGLVSFDYSFDRLAVAGDGKLYYWDNSALTQVTDPNLGYVADVLWIDGYFMTTDGEYIVVTELTDPTVVNPLKYGSSETDPDQIEALLKNRNEVYVLNRYTIEVFQNIVTNNLFPFQRVPGAMVQRGCIGSHACTVFLESVAFVGGGRNESLGVWIASNGSSKKISTREIDRYIKSYSEDELTQVVLEARVFDGYQLLYVHLPDITLVYDGVAHATIGTPVWSELTSSVIGLGQYRARNFVFCYDQWLCGDPTSNNHGYLTDSISSHYAGKIGWSFSTMVLYGDSKGAIIHDLELVCLTGRAVLGDNPIIFTSYTNDGMVWSQEHPRLAGKIGETLKRINWMQQGIMKHWRVQKFRGSSDAHMAFARLEARIEPLAW